ncbi:CrcB family protein [Halorussus aquaticus]|uniref:Fluoride-specific ion channel FluC n=1 Tax=Halorussus aquaticus TaxID=2953748 RepID=A0ABD5Q7G2_9EURY|nr:CrcB family protein [Halorussus aquaticus]
MTDQHTLITRLELIALIGIGGFAGSNLRYFLETVSPGLLSTLLGNALGSLALGVLLYEAIYTGVITSETRLVAATGFLSSFTTYSTFALQTAFALVPLWMLLNVLANYALGFGGILLGRTIVARYQRRVTA